MFNNILQQTHKLLKENAQNILWLLAVCILLNAYSEFGKIFNYDKYLTYKIFSYIINGGLSFIYIKTALQISSTSKLSLNKVLKPHWTELKRFFLAELFSMIVLVLISLPIGALLAAAQAVYARDIVPFGQTMIISLFIMLAIYFIFKTQFILYVILDSTTSFSAALKESLHLTKKHFKKVLAFDFKYLLFISSLLGITLTNSRIVATSSIEKAVFITLLTVTLSSGMGIISNIVFGIFYREIKAENNYDS